MANTRSVDPDADRMLSAAAVAGERVRLDVLGRIVDLPADDFLTAVEALVRSGALVVAPGTAPRCEPLRSRASYPPAAVGGIPRRRRGQ
ncbi:hypothetical protein AB0F43_01410 [Kribbella sp. NPDC023972]|uniref:hypothetical protein n=1 Tax=Kribbella sp. NPDC023972 TaxID=3154795 RepID=UPI00340E3B8D